jgi:hypothetical protein
LIVATPIKYIKIYLFYDGQDHVEQLYALSRVFNLLFQDAIKASIKEQNKKGGISK